MHRQIWKLDKEGNLTSIRQGLRYCAHCEEVKEVVDTVLSKRLDEEDEEDEEDVDSLGFYCTQARPRR